MENKAISKSMHECATSVSEVPLALGISTSETSLIERHGTRGVQHGDAENVPYRVA